MQDLIQGGHSAQKRIIAVTLAVISRCATSCLPRRIDSFDWIEKLAGSQRSGIDLTYRGKIYCSSVSRTRRL